MVRKNDRVIYLFSYKGEQIKIVGTIQKVYKHPSGVWKARMLADEGQPLKECDAPVNEFEVKYTEKSLKDFFKKVLGEELVKSLTFFDLFNIVKEKVKNHEIILTSDEVRMMMRIEKDLIYPGYIVVEV